MSKYRGIDLSMELQSMFDTIMKVTDLQVQEELLDNLENLQEEIEARSSCIREAIVNLESL